ncbi:hypothetical protein P5673_005511 [Acropora cervicornis]|uniref:Uncharacterized protein n=1 Tax=Acropora cervicornis TaxID=6130 RepID=A0AAD9QYM3_ACRCE|nr:hypothetical protein P5673_005511 [Acropora cervicornis]
MRCMREELSNLTSAQIVETSVTNNNSPGDFTQPTNKFHQAKGSQNILERRKLRERFFDRKQQNVRGKKIEDDSEFEQR